MPKVLASFAASMNPLLDSLGFGCGRFLHLAVGLPGLPDYFVYFAGRPHEVAEGFRILEPSDVCRDYGSHLHPVR